MGGAATDRGRSLRWEELSARAGRNDKPALLLTAIAMDRLCQGTVRSARGRSWDLPGDGHEFCPVMAMGSAQRLAITGPRGQVNGLTP